MIERDHHAEDARAAMAAILQSDFARNVDHFTTDKSNFYRCCAHAAHEMADAMASERLHRLATRKESSDEIT